MFLTKHCAQSTDPNNFPEVFGPRVASLYQPLVEKGVHSSIVGATVLHAALAHVNSAVDLESESGQRGPIGVNTMVSGVSGCGKTLAKDYAFGPMVRFHNAYASRNAEEIAEYEPGDQSVSAATRSASAAQVTSNLFETHIFNNASMPAILEGLSSYPVANGIDDEFTARQNGSITQYGNIRVQLQGGQSIIHSRKTTGRLFIVAPRYTEFTTTQPPIRRVYDTKYGNAHRSSGLGPRELFVEYDGHSSPLHPGRINTARWDAICKDFQIKTVRIFRFGERRSSVRFGPEGLRGLDAVRRSYQQRGAVGGDLELFPEHVARQTENIGRIAAGFHTFEGWPGDISGETVERAAVIGEFFTEHYKLRYMPQPQAPREYQEADRLERWLHGFVHRTKELSLRRSDLRAYAPEMGLSRAAVERALTVLCSSNYARISLGKSAWIELNPAYFRPQYHVSRWPLHSQF